MLHPDFICVRSRTCICRRLVHIKKKKAQQTWWERLERSSQKKTSSGQRRRTIIAMICQEDGRSSRGKQFLWETLDVVVGLSG